MTEHPASPSTRPKETLGSELQAVGRHTLVYLLGPAISRAVGFLLIPIYTHFIVPSDYGVLSLVDIAMSLLMLLLAMNVADSLTRFYYATDSQQQRHRLVSSALCGVAALGALLTGLALGLTDPIRGWMSLGTEHVGLLRLGWICAWFSMLAELGYTYLRLRYFSRTFVALTVLQVVASVGLNLWWVVGCGWGIWGILYSTLVTQAVIGSLLVATILVHVRSWPEIRLLQQLLAFGLPLVPASLAQQLNNYLGPVMIRWLLVADPVTVLAQVGLFAAGQRIGCIVNRFVTVPLNAFWKPRRMQLVLESPEDVRLILARMCTYATLLTTQCALWLSVGCESLLHLVVAPQYVAAARVVPLLALAYVVHSLEHHVSIGMYYGHRTRWAMPIGMIALGCLVIVNWWGIPHVGILAAAGATLVAVSVRVVLFYAISQPRYPVPFEWKRLAMILTTAVGLYAVCQTIDSDSHGLELALRLGCGTLFAPLLFLAGFFLPEERRALGRLLRNLGGRPFDRPKAADRPAIRRPWRAGRRVLPFDHRR